jgi:AraC family transcriptional regulator
MPNSVVPRAGYRSVGGQLVGATVAGARHARVELLRRSSGGVIPWQFRQPAATLFWFRSGFRRFRLDIDGRGIEAGMSAANTLCYFPAQVPIDGEFVVDPLCDYAVVFLDPELATARGMPAPDRPFVGFTHERLICGLRDLTREAARPDSVFELYAEGWALSSMAHLVRLTGGLAGNASDRGTGLPAASLRRVEDYVRSRLSERLTVDVLADVAGFSRRHFARAFKQSVGQTPLRYVHEMRINAAKRRLAAGERSITSIAADSGFSHSQHFSTAFRLATGATPSDYRRDCH